MGRAVSQFAHPISHISPGHGPFKWAYILRKGLRRTFEVCQRGKNRAPALTERLLSRERKKRASAAVESRGPVARGAVLLVNTEGAIIAGYRICQSLSP